jgi:hypothetical protein
MSTQFNSPEIHDALRLAEFRATNEYHPFEYDERVELASEVREAIERTDADPETLRLARAVEFRLECEAFDFSDWEERLELARLVREIVRRLEGGAR